MPTSGFGEIIILGTDKLAGKSMRLIDALRSREIRSRSFDGVSTSVNIR